MSKERTESFNAKCWEWAKEYFVAMGRAHLIGVAERSVEMEEEEKND
jgi:hypothetical protein